MNIDEAIKILKLHLQHSDQIEHHELDNAEKLSIEALKAIKRWRDIGVAHQDRLLSGETEE